MTQHIAPDRLLPAAPIPCALEVRPPVLEGEILEPRSTFVLQPHPFRMEVQEVTVPEGLTLEDFVLAAGLPRELHAFVSVEVGDELIPRAWWPRIRPKAGAVVYVRVRPGEGGGGGGRKNVLASVLMLAVTVAASFYAPMIAGVLFPNLSGFGLALAQGAIGAGISMLGALAVNALIPPASADSSISQRGLLSGVRNQLRPYADIPRIFGKRRVYPLQGAFPYTEAQGDNRYVRILLVVGFGPLEITNIRIGETPISSFPNIEYEIREGWEPEHASFGTLPAGKSAEGPLKLFTRDVDQLDLGVLLDHNGSGGAGAYHVQTSSADAVELAVEVTATEGLAEVSADGERKPFTVKVSVEYRATGTSGAWLAAQWDGQDEADGTQTDGILTIEGESATPLIRGGRWKVAKGQYDVRLRYVSGEDEAGDWQARDIDRIDWTALRSVKEDYPVNLPGLAMIALRAKATDNFLSFPDTINCDATSYLPKYSSGTWTWDTSRIPAWAFADVLRRRGTERMIGDTRIDVTGLKSWADACNATAGNAPEPLWLFDAIIEGGSVYSALRQIASHGRASYALRDGLHSVVRDAPRTVPAMHITPRNSWGYSGSKGFLDLPHALKVRFVNAAQGYQDDETIVYMDGYSAANADRFESLELPGCVSETQAWREGRYYLAVGRLRPEVHTVTMDIENLRATRGDLVQLAHDVIRVGLVSARILSRVMAGSLVAGFVLDTAVPYTAGQAFALRARLSTGASVLYALGTAGSTVTTTTVMLASSVAASGAPNAGDLVTFGEATRETAPMVIKAVSPGPDFTARLTLVPEDPAIHTASDSVIPPFNSHVNSPTPLSQVGPDMVGMTLTTDERALLRAADGSLQERILVRLKAPYSPNPITRYDVKYRPAGKGEFKSVPGDSPDDLERAIAGVTQGRFYDVQSRAWAGNLPGPWNLQLGVEVIGKTAQPADVVGLTFDGSMTGGTLYWTPNVEIDVSEYEIREGAVGATWDASATLTPRFKGTRFPVLIAAGVVRQFMVKAVDVIGLRSVNGAAVAGQRSTELDVRLQATLDYANGLVDQLDRSVDLEIGNIAQAQAHAIATVFELRATLGARFAQVMTDVWEVAEDQRSITGALRTEINAVFDRAAALIVQEAGFRVSEDEAQAYLLDLVRVGLEDAEGDIAAQAAAATILEARVTQTEAGLVALAEETTVLTASLGSADDSILAAQLRALIGDHETREAMRVQVADAREQLRAQVSELDGAIAEKIIQLTAGFNGSLAVTDFILRATATDLEAESKARLALVATVATLNASFISEQVATANQFSAQATSITSLQATVGGPGSGLVAEVNTVQTAVADIEGNLAASYVMRVRAGGATGEIEMAAVDDVLSGPASVIRMRADRFQFYADELAEFFGDVSIVGTVSINGRAVTVPAIGTFDNDIDITSTSTWRTLWGKTLPKKAGYGVLFRATIPFAGYGQGTLVLRVRRGASNVVGYYTMPTGEKGIGATLSLEDFDPDTSGGDQKYYFEVRKADAGGYAADLVIDRRCTFYLEETLR